MTKTNENGAATEGNRKPANGSEAIRQALETLGRDEMPVAVQKYVKDEFGIDVTPNLVSNVKAKLKGGSGKKASTAKGPAKKAAAGPKAQAKPAPAKSGGNGQAGKSQANQRQATNGQAADRNSQAGGNGQSTAGISLEDIEAVKQLARRNGAASLHKMIDLLVQ